MFFRLKDDEFDEELNVPDEGGTPREQGTYAHTFVHMYFPKEVCDVFISVLW